MAITNAQQYQQLVNKPADGKRPGYRGVGGYRGGPGGSGGKGGREAPGSKAGSPSERDFSTGPNVGRDPNEKPPTTRIGGKEYDVTPDNVYERQEAENLANLQRQREIDEFINTKRKPINTPFPLVNTAFNFLGNVLPNNRKFYVENVANNKYGYELTEEDYEEYDRARKAGEINAFGRPLTQAERDSFLGRNDGPDQPIIPMTPDDPGEGDDEETSPGGGRDMGGLAPRFAGSIFDFTGLADGGRVPAMGGGIMNTDIIGGAADGNIDEMGRQMYFVGKLVKKATRGIKKIVKSPVGKIALLTAGAGLFGAGPAAKLFGSGKGLAFKNFLAKGILKKGMTDFTLANVSPLKAIGLASTLPLLFGQDDEEEYDSYRGPSIDIANIRNNPYNFLAPRFQGTRFAADGGLMRIGYQEGGDAEPVAKKTMPLIDMDGKEKDYRETGGFVDMGRMERADDVPARLSKNEFVFTADAVRNAGEGNIDKGAEVMYNMMKNLEAGGEVSEESQGLEGARKMFQTSQRLGEVI